MQLFEEEKKKKKQEEIAPVQVGITLGNESFKFKIPRFFFNVELPSHKSLEKIIREIEKRGNRFVFGGTSGSHEIKRLNPPVFENENRNRQSSSSKSSGANTQQKQNMLETILKYLDKVKIELMREAPTLNDRNTVTDVFRFLTDRVRWLDENYNLSTSASNANSAAGVAPLSASIMSVVGFVKNWFENMWEDKASIKTINTINNNMICKARAQYAKDNKTIQSDLCFDKKLIAVRAITKEITGEQKEKQKQENKPKPKIPEQPKPWPKQPIKIPEKPGKGRTPIRTQPILPPRKGFIQQPPEQPRQPSSPPIRIPEQPQPNIGEIKNKNCYNVVGGGRVCFNNGTVFYNGYTYKVVDKRNAMSYGVNDIVYNSRIVDVKPYMPQISLSTRKPCKHDLLIAVRNNDNIAFITNTYTFDNRNCHAIYNAPRGRQIEIILLKKEEI